MKINIKATGIELTSAISDYVYKKVSMIEKFLPGDIDPSSLEDVVAQVEVGKPSEHHKAGEEVFRAEVHLTGGGVDIYAVSKEADLYAAIDTVKDEVSRKLSELKGKRETLARRGARVVKEMMRGAYDSTSRGISWGVERFKFKGFGSFKKRQ